MSDHRVSRHLRVEITEYDRAIRSFIPGYEAMIAAAADAVASVEPTRVVDLGAGTGALSAAILERTATTTVELLDVDPGMLDHARQRLAAYGARARFTRRSYDEPFEPCDAFAASLALHHIPTIRAKAALFARCFAALRPGGVLVNADATMPADEPSRTRLYDGWAAHLVACGIPETRAREHFAEWAEEDTYLPLEQELAALTRAGFEAERVWCEGPMGVVVARTPGG